jgi:hypothetical protein
MMEVCERNHDRIIFDNRESASGCPLCIAYAQVDEAKDLLSEAKDENSDLRGQVMSLEQDMAELKATE